MGASPYSYFTSYQPDINVVLQQLREQEFRAGRYNPAIPFPLDTPEEATGAQHDSINAARAAAAEDGTRSILDLDHISDEPEFFAATPLPNDTLIGLYGTAQPTREMIEENDGFLEDVERGHGVYIITYRDGKPDQIYFGGYSLD